MKVVLLVTLTVVFLAGCTAEDEVAPTRIEDAYVDADKRFVGSVSGGEESSKAFDVECGTPRLSVRLDYEVPGRAQFALQDPDGQSVRTLNVTQSGYVQDASWFEVGFPKPGQWNFTVKVSNGGSYALGIYFENVSASDEGEITSSEIEGAFRDAKFRVVDIGSCGKENQNTFEIPAGSARLNVRAIYFSQSSARLRLSDPIRLSPPGAPGVGVSCRDTDPVKGEEVQPETTARSETWYTTENPRPGCWTFQASFDGYGRYAFGFYY